MTNLVPPVFGAVPKTTYFGTANGFVDSSSGPYYANGQTVVGNPGISLGIPKSSPDFGQWYTVTAPNGQSQTLQQVDVGPNADKSTAALDVSASALPGFGYSPSNPPPQSGWTITPAATPSQTSDAPATGGVTSTFGDGSTLSIDPNMTPNSGDPFASTDVGGPAFIPGTSTSVGDQALNTDFAGGTPGDGGQDLGTFNSAEGLFGPSSIDTGATGALGTGSTSANAPQSDWFAKLLNTLSDLGVRFGLILFGIVIVGIGLYAATKGEVSQQVSKAVA